MESLICKGLRSPSPSNPPSRVSVNEGGTDQPGEEKRVNQGQPGRLRPEGQPAGAEKNGCQELDQNIADGDRAAAIPAFAAEVNPAQQGNVQMPGDGVLAGRAMGPWRNDRLSKRQPMYADIEKAADGGTEYEKHH